MRQPILQEATYAQTMTQTVKPFLFARQTLLPLQPEPGRALYCVFYRADRPVGTVVLCHGFTESAEKYKEIAYYFLQEGYNVLAYDHCGHGRSYRLVKDLSLVHVDKYHRYVQDLLAVAAQAKAQQPDLPLYLYAHSMGGGVAAAALAQQPRLFQKAILNAPMVRPRTGGVPWPVARALAWVLSHVGKADGYVPGGHPFDGKETFEESASTCRERFAYYQQQRNTEKLLQTCAASCGWLNQAARLSNDLLTKAYKAITTPVLIFQAGQDTFVDNGAQQQLANKLQNARLVRVEAAKHEIFNSDSATLVEYWQTVFAFLAE